MFMLSAFFYILSVVVGKIVPAVHAYAWMIILVALSKAFGFIPEKFEKAAQQWSQFVMKNWTSALLVGIGISMIDLGAVISAFSPLYMLLVLLSIQSEASAFRCVQIIEGRKHHVI